MVSSVEGNGSVAKILQQQRQQVESQKEDIQHEQQRATERQQLIREKQERVSEAQRENNLKNDPTNPIGRSVDISV